MEAGWREGVTDGSVSNSLVATAPPPCRHWRVATSVQKPDGLEKLWELRPADPLAQPGRLSAQSSGSTLDYAVFGTGLATQRLRDADSFFSGFDLRSLTKAYGGVSIVTEYLAGRIR